MAVSVTQKTSGNLSQYTAEDAPKEKDLYVDYKKISQVSDKLRGISSNAIGITAQNAVEDAVNQLINVKGFDYMGVQMRPDCFRDFFDQAQGIVNDLACQFDSKSEDAHQFDQDNLSQAILNHSNMRGAAQELKPNTENLPNSKKARSLFMNADHLYIYSQHGYYDRNGNWVSGGWDQRYQEGYDNGLYSEARWMKPIDTSGCSTATSAMVASNLTGKEITPDAIKPIYRNDYANIGGNFADEVFAECNLDYSTRQNFSSKDSDGNLIIDNVLQNGGAIIRSVTLNPNDWNGHYVALLKEKTLDNETYYYFADPDQSIPGKWITKDSPEFQWMIESHGTTIMVAKEDMSIDDAMKAPPHAEIV